MIVCGLPGAGKTTLARTLEQELGAVRLSADEWMVELGIDLFATQERALVERLQRAVAERLLTLGQRVVIEWGTWSRAERDDLRERARALGAAVELRVLDTPVPVLWERVQRRGWEQRFGSRALTRAELESYAAVFERPGDDELALYDPALPPPAPRDERRGREPEKRLPTGRFHFDICLEQVR